MTTLKNRLFAYRWFILALLFLAVNTWGVYRYARPPVLLENKAGLLQCQPEGSITSKRQELTWTFNTPMEHARGLGTWTDYGPVRITPDLPGRFTWISPQTLIFEPQQDWADCQQYRVELDPDLKDLERMPVQAIDPVLLTTPGLQLVQASQVDLGADSRLTLRLDFSHPPERHSLKEKLQLHNEAGQPISWEFLGADTRNVLLRTDPVNTHKVKVLCKPGLLSTAGPLATDREFVQEVKTERNLTVSSLRPYSYAFEQGQLRVQFSHPVKLEQLARHIEVDPEVSFTVKNGYSWSRGHELRLTGEFEPGAKYTLRFREGLETAKGSTLPKTITRNVRFPDRPASIAFRNPGNYLSTRGSKRIVLSTVSARSAELSLHRIYPNNIVTYALRRADRYNHWGVDEHLLTQEVGTRTVKIKEQRNQVVETTIDLEALMGEHRSGAFMLRASTEGRSASHLVVVSDIGISVKEGKDGLLLWANGLLDLAPIGEADVRVFSESNQEIFRGSTDARGLATVPLEEGAFLVTVQQGDDLSYLRLYGNRFKPAGDTAGAAYQPDSYDAYLFTDRGIYRPGETAHVKAVVRDAKWKVPGSFPVALEVFRPDGKRHGEASGVLNANGTVQCDISWPDHAPTGRYRFELKPPGSKEVLGVHHVAVEEYVPPRIAVSVERNEARAVPGDILAFDVSGRYLFGAPAEGLKASGWIEFRSAPFEHADWKGWHFGDAEKAFTLPSRLMGQGVLDEHGAGRFSEALPLGWRPPAAVKAIFGAQVMEHSGRATSAYTAQMIDVYPWYFGLKLPGEGGRIRTGMPWKVELAAVRPDGSLQPALRAKYRVQQVDWVSVLKQVNNRYRYQSERRLIDLTEQALSLDEGRGSISFTPPHSGEFLLTVFDPKSGSSASAKVQAQSPDRGWYAWSKEAPDRIELELDREAYEPGQTARLLAKAPFAGRALLTIETDRVIDSRLIEFDTNTRELEIPVSPDWPANVYACLNLIRPVKAGEEHSAPHRAVGVVSLKVHQPERRLDIAIDLPESVRPLSRLKAGLRVANREGAGVPCELVVAAVDEGICMLTDFKTPDPLTWFERKRGLGVQQTDLYNLLMPEIESVVLGAPSETGGGGGIAGALRTRLNPIKAKRFKSVALWAGQVQTDEQGFAEVEFDLPEFNGELRFMVVAIHQDQFGSAEAPVQVKRPLIVQHGLPRFMAPGDSCTVPLHLFNQSDAGMQVEMKLNCEGPLGHSGFEPSIHLDAGEQGLRTVTLQAGTRPGKATFTLSLQSGGEHFEETVELAVRPAAPRITHSGGGLVKPGETMLVNMPGEFLDGTGLRRLQVSPSPAIELGGGLDYLLRYPYGCLEQTTSSAFPLVYLRELYEQVQGDEAQGVEDFVQGGIYRILSMQHQNGGFSYWAGRDHYSWGSIYATHFLVEAQRAGFDVPEDSLNHALVYLEKQLESGNGSNPNWPLRSYACRVLACAGKKTDRWLNRMMEEVEDMELAAQVNVAGALAAAGRRREAGELLKRLSPDGIQEYRDTDGALNSTTRDLAALLMAWVELDPEAPAVPALVTRLNRQKLAAGNWGTTQENAMALMALGKYCKHLRGAAEEFAGTAVCDGKTRSFDHREKRPIALTDGTVEISNAGPGNLYYYWSSAGIPVGGEIAETDRGIRARRSLLDLQGKPLDPGALQQGELVLVQVEIDAKSAVENLAIEDLLPAGLEVENPKLATSQQVSWKHGLKTLPLRNVELRDDRVVLFTGRFSGKRVFHYAARAVAKGQYVHPPLMAECMYDPSIRSVHGRQEIIVQ